MSHRLHQLPILSVSLLCLMSCCLQPSAFFSMSPAERDAAFAQYPLSQQLDLYLEGMRFEPPHMELTEKVASNGTKIVPIVVQRLEGSGSRNREALFELLIVISSNYCDLGSDQQLMAKLEQLAASTPDERERKRDEESVEKIAIRNYPLAHQLTLLLDSNDGQGDWNVIRPVASHGAEVIPLTLEKLKDAKSDEARLTIFDFLWNVSYEDCSVSKDAALLVTLKANADSMEDPDARRRAYLWIEKIQGDCMHHPKVAAAKVTCS